MTVDHDLIVGRLATHFHAASHAERSSADSDSFDREFIAAVAELAQTEIFPGAGPKMTGQGRFLCGGGLHMHNGSIVPISCWN